MLGEVQREVVHVQKILSDLLDYARTRPPDFRPADLNATAQHAVALARQQVLSRPVEIQFLPCDDLAAVEHDAGQIQEVLLNLLLNAIQAIPSAGNVRVSVAPRDSFVVVTVADTGRGIPAEHLPNIFRPFFTTKGQGTGLGLSLAKRIVEAHGGRIEVASSPGRGSEFTLWLPFRKAATPGGSS